ncbi:NAD(P)/FAD-dependent oxidoreductase [Nocardioides sp. R-C-SC26]|uniref:flavin-containing monooxygenase n=1 Tax=Nocardioides sp. R-C-SC26 TaxID=2870414 RepID=UPI001E4D51A8|nr:NAD(P)/FAD-dependent oxidoreductase [Nocardioides sp. R-C-SC26]
MSSPVDVDTLIIGSGFAGLCAAIKLQEAGERDFVVIEKGSTVGGTWRDNTYPGAACDVPSQLYSFSFAPNPDWSMSFSPQPEILAYLERVARDSGTLDRFVFDTTVENARWDGGQDRWLVSTSGATYAARVVISGAGGLSAPKLPAIDGIEDFAGEIFHSARWDHDVDLAGKRVAVIGTGASSIQIVPAIQPTVGHLDVYQRTAPWVIPRNDRRYPAFERAALRHVPGLQDLYRTAIYWGREGYVPAFTRAPKLATPAKQMALANIRKGISDPALRAKVTPDFQIGCKRILISNTYYPALAADNTDLVTDPIARITPSGIVTSDGTERAIDVLIVATGFHTTELPITEHLVGRSGTTLADRWEETGMSAYKGTAVADFPNLFFIVGPNTGLGHSSMVFMIESQVTYIVDAIRSMRRNGYSSVEVREDVERAWSASLQQRMKRTVWSTGGCASWYLDKHGNNTTLWPRSTFSFRGALARFDAGSYRVAATTPSHATPSSTDREESLA